MLSQSMRAEANAAANAKYPLYIYTRWLPRPSRVAQLCCAFRDGLHCSITAARGRKAARNAVLRDVRRLAVIAIAKPFEGGYTYGSYGPSKNALYLRRG